MQIICPMCSGSGIMPNDTISWGGWTVLPRGLSAGNVCINLISHEVGIMRSLVSVKGRMVPFYAIYEVLKSTARNQEYDCLRTLARQYIRLLRLKIGANYIVTYRGADGGYKLLPRI